MPRELPFELHDTDMPVWEAERAEGDEGALARVVVETVGVVEELPAASATVALNEYVELAARPVHVRDKADTGPVLVPVVEFRNVYGSAARPEPESEALDIEMMTDEVPTDDKERAPGTGRVASTLNAIAPPFAVEYDDVAFPSDALALQ